MDKTRELSNGVRQEMITRHKEGKGNRKIAAELNLVVSTVGAIVRKWKRTEGETKKSSNVLAKSSCILLLPFSLL